MVVTHSHSTEIRSQQQQEEAQRELSRTTSSDATGTSREVATATIPSASREVDMKTLTSDPRATPHSFCGHTYASSLSFYVVRRTTKVQSQQIRGSRELPCL